MLAQGEEKKLDGTDQNYRKNIQLEDQVHELQRKVQKYKKRLQRKKRKGNKVNNTANNRKANTIKKEAENILFYQMPERKNKVIKTNDINQIIPQINVNKKLNYDNMIDKEKSVELTQWVRTTDIIEKNGKKVKIKDEDDKPPVNVKKSVNLSVGNIHPLLIKNGTHILVKVPSGKKAEYIYLGVAKSGVDEDGDVWVMFYKTVGDTEKLLKLVKSDVSDVMFENLLKIIPTPKEVKRGRRVY
ncbi:hypothetical protein FQA39_LY03427 [Lamprigera yunnana]|nr:hypothetical protein FQA39_LY03427 [Lamprigera yunnana]